MDDSAHIARQRQYFLYGARREALRLDLRFLR